MLAARGNQVTDSELALTRKLRKPRFAAVALIAAAVLYAGSVRLGQAQGEVPALAVAEIQYSDTSGEGIDQSADHVRRLRAFEVSLRTDLAAGGKIRNV